MKQNSEILIDRDEVLVGATYKIKPGSMNDALYVTINDNGSKVCEIFINTKCSESLSWIVVMTRMMSAVMRMTDNIDFMINELKQIQDPKHNYFYKGLGHIPSIQYHIGTILERHVNSLNNKKES